MVTYLHALLRILRTMTPKTRPPTIAMIICRLIRFFSIDEITGITTKRSSTITTKRTTSRRIPFLNILRTQDILFEYSEEVLKVSTTSEHSQTEYA